MPFDSTTAASAGRKGGKRTKDPVARRDKSLRMTVTQGELDAIDAKAAAENISRTELVVRAIREYRPDYHKD